MRRQRCGLRCALRAQRRLSSAEISDGEVAQIEHKLCAFFVMCLGELPAAEVYSRAKDDK